MPTQMIRFGTSSRALAAALVAALALPGAAVAATSKQRPEARRAAPARLGVFTPSLIDTAPGLARGGSETRLFRFTPSGKPGRAATLGLRARQVPAADAVRAAEEAAGYDVDVSLGVRGVALTGQMSEVDDTLTRREAVALGLAYGRRDWSTQLKVGAEDARARGLDARFARRYSVEMGGAYQLRRNVAVGAGVSYRVLPENERLARGRVAEDGAAFVGAKVAF